MTEQEFAAIRKRLGVMRDHPWKVEGYPIYTTQGHGISVWHPADGGIEGAANAPITSAVKAVPGDLETLIRAVEERDAIIHDLQLDGAALSRRAVEEFAAGLVESIRGEKRDLDRADYDNYNAGMCVAYKSVIRHIQEAVSSKAPDPLPPDQVRAENERLREKLKAIREKITHWFDCVENWRSEWPGTERALKELREMAKETS